MSSSDFKISRTKRVSSSNVNVIDQIINFSIIYRKVFISLSINLSDKRCLASASRSIKTENSHLNVLKISIERLDRATAIEVDGEAVRVTNTASYFTLPPRSCIEQEGCIKN